MNLKGPTSKEREGNGGNEKKRKGMKSKGGRMVKGRRRGICLLLNFGLATPLTSTMNSL